jgi:hypothetical protein
MRHRLAILSLYGLCAVGCTQHPLADYRPLDSVGMGSSSVEELKTLHPSDSEIAQMVRLKQGGISDETSLALLRAARTHQHPFNSADWAVSLVNAKFSEQQILSFAQSDQLDLIGGEAITLKLIGLSDATVTQLLQRRSRGLPTLGSAQISRLKNTGLTERQIVEQINQGMTDEAAEKLIKARENARNHANTGFTRNRGRIAH